MLLLSLVLLGTMTSSVVKADDADDVLSLIPGSANAISLIRVQELVRTQRGVREGWAKSGAIKTLAGVEHLPMNVSYVVRAAHLVSGENNNGWSVSLFPWPKESSIVDLARFEKGDVDMINNVATVKAPKLGYIVRLRPDTLGIVSPADRQEVARWTRFAKGNAQPVISDYLREAIELNSSHILLAFDTDEMIPFHLVRAYLANSPVMKRQAVDLEDFAEWMSGLRGIQLNVRVDEKLHAELRFDFVTDVGRNSVAFQKVFAEFLSERGVPVIELDDALPITQDKTLKLRMDLSEESLGGLMSTLPVPGARSASPPPAPVPVNAPAPAAASVRAPAAANAPAAAPANIPGPPAADAPVPVNVPPQAQGAAPGNVPVNAARPRIVVDGLATSTYYHDIMKILDDVERFNSRASDYVKTALWQDKFASQIDKLPIHGVDGDLVQFGSGAANNLRALASSLRSVPTKVGALDGAITSQVTGAGYALSYDPLYGYQYVPAGNNYVTENSNVAKIREKQASVVIKGSDERLQLWDLLLSERSSIRHKMMERYPGLSDNVQKN